MKIIIFRHGKVDYPPITMLSACELVEWAHAYNTNQLDKESQPTEKAKQVAVSVNAVVCSELPRSIESAQVLGVNEITYSNSLFNEAGLPIAGWNFPKLSVRIWAIFFRLAWLMGYSNNSETKKDAKQRASLAAKKLIELAESHKSVAFIGHGIMNRFIADELRYLGWVGPKSPAKNYWEYGVFSVKT